MNESGGKRIDRKEISRRWFLKRTSTAVGAGIVAGSVRGAAETQPAEIAPSIGHVPGYCGEGDWLGTPPAIPDSQIAKAIDVDVLVLGGGHAGVLAALGASDKGAKVAIVEKKDEAGFLKSGTYWIGQDIASVNSKWLLNMGYGPYDTGEIAAEYVRRGGGRCNPQIVSLFVENSGVMFDRMAEVYESYAARRKADDSEVKVTYSDGTSETLDCSNVMSKEFMSHHVQRGRSPKDYPIVCGGYKTWPCTHQILSPTTLKHGGIGLGSPLHWFEKYMVRKSRDNGAQWFYEHTAVVLTQDAGGAVTGAIAKDKSGGYLRINARKGVIVTTGDFSGNKNMFWALMNEVMERAQREKTSLDLKNFVPPGTSDRDGGGHKMCCWAGGTIEPTPRALMSTGSIAVKNFPWGMTPMLLLNSRAERFANEAAAFPLGHIAFRQPAGSICLVTDRNYLKSILTAGIEHGGPNFGRPEWFENMQEDMGKVLDAGAKGYMVRGITIGGEVQPVYGARTLEELAGYLGYTGDLVQTFLESIRQYNGLCRKGVDVDFGKDANAMIPIEQPPFYGCKNNHAGQKLGTPTMCGLITDNKLRVLDKASRPIKGLYVAGNTLGGRFGMGYSTPIAGSTMGMAMTHGWLAGKFAAES